MLPIQSGSSRSNKTNAIRDVGRNVSRLLFTRTSALERGLCFLICVFFLQGCQAQEVRTERITRFVDELVFGGPLDVSVPANPRLLKWTHDLEVAVTGTDVGEHRPRASEAVAYIIDAFGLHAEMCHDCETADITISFVEEKDFLINGERVVCYANVHDIAGRIQRARVVLSTARPEQIDRCLAHELLHALGLRNHSGIVRSVLSMTHGEEGVTPWDELALRVLYDDRLKPGATREEALAVFRTVIPEMMAKP